MLKLEIYIYCVTCIGIHMRKIYLAEERNLSIHCDGIMCSLIPQVGLEGIEHKFQHIKYVG